MHRNSTLEVRVRNIIEETSTIKRFTLQAIDYSMLPPFSGGSHITTFLPHHSGNLERHYSIFNITSEMGLFEIAVRLAEDSTGGSRYWHQNVHVGDILSVSYPKNYFPLSFQAKHHVFYAAGIGITPFLSMMAELVDKNRSFELHYAAKSKEQCAFYDYLRKEFPDQCHFYFSNGEGTNRLLPTQLLNHRIGTHVYFCGPESMIQDFKIAAKTFGYPSFNIHLERFAPPPKKEQHAFQVNLKRSDTQLEVPANSSLLDVLLQNGIKIPYSCRVGGCGTCEIKVEEGQIIHFDSFLSEEQQCSKQTMLSCVSRGKGRLVLDI
ncbi:PDR/VanB family oxidoreductase [Brevibacillus choshinensis]|uniref:PDR/VanB family oxidoreductase n=1 Tax=Brevibacillus choshinensis TaxID=54911 RepID=UPI002E222061|nr:PDR/VanB family oxidoreductase [Brevibacillus choshinensis]MED4785169.1 PDR/VanB family oxidoreductase [Brevibacillus choshinensis]